MQHGQTLLKQVNKVNCIDCGGAIAGRHWRRVRCAPCRYKHKVWLNKIRLLEEK